MRNKIYAAALLATVAASLSSCELDEYNPAAGTGGDVTATYEGILGLESYCYEPIYGKLFSAFDYLALAECGTDITLCAANKTWAAEVFYYEGLTTNTNYSNKIFLQAYSLINTCNYVINKAGDVVDGDEDDLKVIVAEAKCLRAFYYLLLTTQYGNVTLKLTTSEEGTNLNPQRATYEELYSQIVTDLKEAAEDLGTTPFNDQYARVTKKTALGLLARAYVQGAGEGLSENGVSYWKRALEVAEDFITNMDAYGAYMYDTVEDLWTQTNNRNNKEALFIAAGIDANNSLPSTYSDCNIFTYTYPDPNKLSDVYTTSNKQNYFYGRVNNNVFAPSKYLIDLFDEENDARWSYSYTTAFGYGVIPSWSFPAQSAFPVWTEALATTYGKDASVVGDTIKPLVQITPTYLTWTQYTAYERPAGTTAYELADADLITAKNVYATPYPMDLQDDRYAIYLSKTALSDEERAASPIVIINLDDMFDSDGNYQSASFDGTNSYQLFPGLAKYNWNYDGVFGSNLQKHNGDIMIMRTAEMYLIAAEAAQKTGDEAKAAEYLNVVRKRACRDQSTFDSTMKLSTASEQDVLDEYARELCGEFTRWAVLKRHKAFESQLAKGNTRAAASFDASKHYNRPISYDFLSQINNADEYGTNGY